MKTRIKKVFIVLLCLNLLGCTMKYGTNFYKKNRGFLKYSLGDYELLSEDRVKETASPIPMFVSYQLWRLKYKDGDNAYILEFSNYSENMKEHMANEIVSHLEKRVKEDVKIDSAGLFPSADEVSFNIRISNPEDIDTFIKKKKGIQLSNFEYSDIGKYGMKYTLNIRIKTESENDIAVYQNIVNQAVINFMDKIEDVDTSVWITIENTNLKYEYKAESDNGLPIEWESIS